MYIYLRSSQIANLALSGHPKPLLYALNISIIVIFPVSFKGLWCLQLRFYNERWVGGRKTLSLTSHWVHCVPWIVSLETIGHLIMVTIVKFLSMWSAFMALTSRFFFTSETCHSCWLRFVVCDEVIKSMERTHMRLQRSERLYYLLFIVVS